MILLKLNFVSFILIFFIVHCIESTITTELWEKSIQDLKKEFNHRLDIMQEIHEREIEEMKKRISDPNEMFNQINNKLCYSKEFRSGKINGSNVELENQTVVENKMENFWDDLKAYDDQKCIKIFDKKRLMTFDDALKLCLQLGNGSTILTINSKEEQNLISKFLFKTHNIVDGIWIGLKNKNNSFDWADGSELSFENWVEGSPTNKTDNNCVRMIADSSPIGQWADELCDKKHLVVCQKQTAIKIKKFSQKDSQEISEQLRDTHKQLNETQNNSKQSIMFNNTLITYLDYLTSDKWINFKIFTDSDGKRKALFFPTTKPRPFKKVSVFEAIYICDYFNAELPEVQTEEKQFILESFMGQFGLSLVSNNISSVWLLGGKHSDGKWMWLYSNEEFTFNNWQNGYPIDGSVVIDANFENDMNTFGKWRSHSDGYSTASVVCEKEVNF